MAEVIVLNLDGKIILINVLLNGLVKSGYIQKDIIENDDNVTDIGNKMLRTLGFCETFNENDLLNENGTIDMLKLKELEIEANMFINEPTMYVSSWKELWDKQFDLRRQPGWLEETIEFEKDDEDRIINYY